jgi:phage terminase large subunit GpA-like protein
METTCEECGKKFSLDFRNVYIGSEQHPPYADAIVITCPHCKERKEI